MFHGLFKNKSIEQPVKRVSQPVVIFDFDGVLANSLHIILAAVNEYAKLHKIDSLHPTSYQDLVSLRDNPTKVLNIKDVISIGKDKIAKMMIDCLSQHVAETAIYDGVKELIAQLRDLGATMAIVTANRAATAMEFLKLHGLQERFHFVISSEGVNKTTKLLSLVKDNKWSKENTYYVTGRTDYIPTVKPVAQSVGAVWGLFDTKESFLKVKSDHVVETPEQLLSLMRQRHFMQTEDVVTTPVPATAATTAAP